MAHILVAEDDVEQAGLRKMLLEAMGHQATVALSPVEVMRRLENELAELIIMDLRFPDAASGLSLIRAIRSRGWQVPLLVVSGWPDEIYGAPEESMVSRIMMKPIPGGELRKAVDELTSASGRVQNPPAASL